MLEDPNNESDSSTSTEEELGEEEDEKTRIMSGAKTN